MNKQSLEKLLETLQDIEEAESAINKLGDIEESENEYEVQYNKALRLLRYASEDLRNYIALEMHESNTSRIEVQNKVLTLKYDIDISTRQENNDLFPF